MGYEKDLENAQKYAERVRIKNEIEKIKHSNDEKRQHLSFSKIAVIFIFINCFIIELYSMVVMVLFHDLTSLGSLVMAVLGQCVSLMGYFIKSTKENTSQGIVYETAMYELKTGTTEEDDGAVG